MSELRGKNVLMEDLFHAHWSKNHRHKKKKNQRRAHLQIKGQYFKEGEAFTKTFKCNNFFFLLKSHVFGHKSKK